MSTTAGATRRVTAADVARTLGLSRATVGFVLNDTPGQSIPEGTRRRVLEEAQRLGYRPHRAARALASGQSRIVLLVLPDWPIDHSMRVHLDEASLALDEAGYSLVTTTPHPSGYAQPLWETLAPDVVLGLVPFRRADLDRLRASGVRRIVPDVPAEELAHLAGHPVGADLDVPTTPGAAGFAEGPRLQVDHLLARGCSRLAFAGSTDPRVRDLVSARRALARRRHRDSVGRELLRDADVCADSAGDVVREWVAAGVDGVVAYNDDVAALLVGAALRAGVDVPGDLAVVGHDDSPLASLFVPSLTSVRVDSAGLGRYLAAMALSAVAGAPPPTAGPAGEAVLVERESS